MTQTSSHGEQRVKNAQILQAPSPVIRLETPWGAQLWIKNDGALSGLYGGNKLRKLERVLPRVKALGRERIITFGAAGSHHALATACHARQHGLRAAAVLVPQVWTLHAETTLRAALAQGLLVYPVQSGLEAIGLLPQLMTPRDFLLAPGGLGPLGSSGFVSAIEELSQQIACGVMPEPEVIVVAAGTGSTAAGLLLGLSRGPLSSRLVAVSARRSWALRASILAQALLTAAHLGLRVRPAELARRLEVRSDLVGPGYGQPTETTARAEQIAEGFALTLEPTYTARAFAHALRLTGHPRFKGGPTCERVLYWHTLSTAPMTPLLATATPLPNAQWFERLLPRTGKPHCPEAQW